VTVRGGGLNNNGLPCGSDPCRPSLNLRLKTSSTVQTGIAALVGTVTAWSAM
jgi:hypothetical protein